MICDNKAQTHNPETIGEDNSAIFVYCRDCGAKGRIGRDLKGSPNNREYGEWFKREFLQPGPPLFYKYYGAKRMNVV